MLMRQWIRYENSAFSEDPAHLDIENIVQANSAIYKFQCTQIKQTNSNCQTSIIKIRVPIVMTALITNVI